MNDYILYNRDIIVGRGITVFFFTILDAFWTHPASSAMEVGLFPHRQCSIMVYGTG